MITHKHHIIPKHAGGSDHSDNIIRLTIPEHADAHKKLFEKNGMWQDELAWRGLSGQISCAEAIKEAQIKGNSGNKHKLGYITPETTKKRISNSLLGSKHSEEHRLNNSNAHKNVSHSANHIKNRTNALKKSYKITFPDGKIEIITGLKDFANKHGLHYSNLCKAANRKNTYKQYNIKKLDNASIQ